MAILAHGDDSLVHQGKRAEDQSFWFRSSYWITKYKVLIWLGGAILLALGFDFKTPAQAMKAIQTQIDTLKRDRDALQASQREIKREISDIKYLVCLGHPSQSVCQPR